MLWHIFENGWEDKEFIRQRVYGLDEVRKEVARWTPDEVERVCGVPEHEVYEAAKTMASHRPGTFIWCMGGTQHTIGNNNEGAWKHWARVWDLDYDWIKGRFDQASYEKKGDKSIPPMHTKGIPVSRWIDGVLEDKANIAQKDNIKAMIFWGHAPNSQTRGKEMKTAMEKLDMMVIIDPYPTVSAVMHDRTDGGPLPTARCSGGTR